MATLRRATEFHPAVGMPSRSGPGGSGHLTLEVLLKRSLDGRWDRYVQILRETQKNPSEKMVHDLRVATRRLISSVDLVGTVIPDSSLRGMRAELRNGLKGFNPLRDVQVELLAVGEMLPRYPVIEPFHTILLLRERRLIKEISKRIAKVPAERMEKDLRSAMRQLQSLLEMPGARDVAFAAIVGKASRAFARAVERWHTVDPKEPVSIHKLRIAFKKARYTLEALQPVFPSVTGRQLKHMNDYQQLMGDIQDVEVLRASINSYALRRHKTRDASIQTLRRELLLRRDECMKRFLSSADDLFKFWHREFVPGGSLQVADSRTSD